MRHYQFFLKGRMEDNIEIFSEQAIETHLKDFAP